MLEITIYNQKIKFKFVIIISENQTLRQGDRIKRVQTQNYTHILTCLIFIMII
jgi:hypothetical protein